MRCNIKKLIKIIVPTLFLALAVTIFTCNYVIGKQNRKSIYSEIADIPENKVGLLLGTSPKLRGGDTNLYFEYRIEAAAALFHSGKIKYILVSGDNRKNNYNEPEEMKRALIAAGIPEKQIILDYAGLRTLDSVVRAKLIFGLDRFTIISQEFHNERALYLARYNDIEAIAFNARDVDNYSGFKTQIRELLARVKVFVDIATCKSPRHLGEKIEIPQ